MSYKWLAVLVCLFGAAIVAVARKDGWGWFLFVAVLIAGMSP